jgi:predicted O-methyltransferase YrrM
MLFDIANHARKVSALLRHRRLTTQSLDRVLWDFGMPWNAIKPEPLASIFPGIASIPSETKIHHALERTKGTSIELDELCVLVTVARFLRPKRILEIGTFDGNTTLNLAANTDAQVVTVDLPPGARIALLKKGDVPNVRSEQRGTQFQGHPLASRIRQVFGDSGTMDWSSLGEPFDLIYLDGCHTSTYVHSDTQNALRMLTPGGIIVWHDYTWRSVSKVIDSYAKHGVRVIQGTRFAVLRVETPGRVLDAIAEQSFESGKRMAAH